MASTPDFEYLALLVCGIGGFLGWVVSDVLEEQLLGRARRERQRAVRKVARRGRTSPPAVTLPRAQVRRTT
ncbi:hypothetical protein BH11MYX3_BH11MYX3_35210 [soil metagenome]